VLIKEFSNSPHSFNWNLDGVIFLDDVSIPNSDIYVFFPNLFKGRYQKHLIGFSDFVQKIHEMGLTNLIKQKNVKVKNTSAATSPSNSASAGNWWYLGP
jgi:hypothetical protein